MNTAAAQNAITEVAQPAASVPCENGVCSVEAGFAAKLRAKAEAQTATVPETSERNDHSFRPVE